MQFKKFVLTALNEAALVTIDALPDVVEQLKNIEPKMLNNCCPLAAFNIPFEATRLLKVLLTMITGPIAQIREPLLLMFTKVLLKICN